MRGKFHALRILGVSVPGLADPMGKYLPTTLLCAGRSGQSRLAWILPAEKEKQTSVYLLVATRRLSAEKISAREGKKRSGSSQCRYLRGIERAHAKGGHPC